MGRRRAVKEQPERTAELPFWGAFGAAVSIGCGLWVGLGWAQVAGLAVLVALAFGVLWLVAR